MEVKILVLALVALFSKVQPQIRGFGGPGLIIPGSLPGGASGPILGPNGLLNGPGNFGPLGPIPGPLITENLLSRVPGPVPFGPLNGPGPFRSQIGPRGPIQGSLINENVLSGPSGPIPIGPLFPSTLGPQTGPLSHIPGPLFTETGSSTFRPLESLNGPWPFGPQLPTFEPVQPIITETVLSRPPATIPFEPITGPGLFRPQIGPLNIPGPQLPLGPIQGSLGPSQASMLGSINIPGSLGPSGPFVTQNTIAEQLVTAVPTVANTFTPRPVGFPGLPITEYFTEFSTSMPVVQASNAPIVSTSILNPPSDIPTQIITTTVVDNSMANSLVNALQMLIYSNMIGCNSNPTLGAEVITSVSAPTIDIITPTEISVNTPYYGGVTEIVSPVTTNVYESISEVNSYSNVESFGSPNIYSSVSEFSPSYPVNPPNVYTEIPGVLPSYPSSIGPLPPSAFGGLGNVANALLAKAGVLGPLPSNPYGVVPEIVSPYQTASVGLPSMYGSLPELSPFPSNVGPYSSNAIGASELSFPYLITPEALPLSNMYTGFDNVITTLPSLALPEVMPSAVYPNFGYPESNVPFVAIAPNSLINGAIEIVNPVSSFVPSAAEVLIPASIPAKLICNYDFVDGLLSVVSINADPIAFESVVY